MGMAVLSLAILAGWRCRSTQYSEPLFT